MSVAAEIIRAPSLALLLLEGRALWELGAYYAAGPILRRAPRGDGHPVLVMPGLAATEVSTRPLRAFLRHRGYRAHDWKQGRNIGDLGLLEPLQERLHALRKQKGCKVSLIGWSLGGIYARELAKQSPDDVRLVITLGSPFVGDGNSNARRVYEFLSGRRSESADDRAIRIRLRQPPPVPTTSIFTRSDGIVAWQSCIEQDTPLTENIEVSGSHSGLGHNPLALYAVADRLAQPEGQWTPFARNGFKKLLYPDRLRRTS
ncbi:MAG: esterase/lipase family protein [Nevskiales bacterium]